MLRYALADTIHSYKNYASSVIGAAKDMALFAGGLVFVKALHPYAGGFAFFLHIALMLFFVLGVLCNASDWAVFLHTDRRISREIIHELTLVNINTALDFKKKSMLYGVLLGAFACSFLLYGNIDAVGFSFLFGSVFFLSLLAYAGSLQLRGHVFYYGQIQEYVRKCTNERVRTIEQSAVINFFRVLWGMFRTRKESLAYRYTEYTENERSFLRELGILRGYPGVLKSCRPHRFKKIVLVCLESVAQSMIPFYNRALPGECMPFLSSLLSNYPALHNYHTSNLPTQEGLHAMHLSRLQADYDCSKAIRSLPALPKILHGEGFTSYALSGITGKYGATIPFITQQLGYRNFYAKEQIREIYPGAPECHSGWGLADRALYDVALALLSAGKGDSMLVTLLPANTHPLFFHTLPEESFPLAIRKTQSRMLRSLYEADLDLRYFFRELSKRGLFNDDTLVIVTADHNPTHGAEYLRYANRHDYKAAKIPCIFVASREENNPFAGIKKGTITDQLDFLPTLLDGLGIPPPLLGLQGASLFRGGKGVAISRTGSSVMFRSKGSCHECDFAGPASSADMPGGALRKWYMNSMLLPYMPTPTGVESV